MFSCSSDSIFSGDNLALEFECQCLEEKQRQVDVFYQKKIFRLIPPLDKNKMAKKLLLIKISKNYLPFIRYFSEKQLKNFVGSENLL